MNDYRSYDDLVVSSIINSTTISMSINSTRMSETDSVNLINNTINKALTQSSDKQIDTILPLLSLFPSHHHIYFILGFIYYNQNKLDESRSFFNMSLMHNNKNISTFLQLALIYRSIKNNTAIQLLERANFLDPNDMRVLNTLAVLYVEVNRYEDGEKTFLKVVSNPTTEKEVAVKCLSNLGTVTSSLGKNISSIKYLCLADKLSNGSGHLNEQENSGANGTINVDISMLQTKLLILNNIFPEELNNKELSELIPIEKNREEEYIYNEHLKINTFYSKVRRLIHNRDTFIKDKLNNKLNNKLNGDKRIKIGYVSSDLRNHVVTKFMYDIIKNHNRDKFDIYCYYNFKIDDHLAQEFKKLPLTWTSIYTLTDDEAANAIFKNGIDILIDLNGHTNGNRLGVFARRPAPVQITYLGYPNTTGVKEMDYRISDKITNSPDSKQKNSEKFLYLDCFIHYNPTIFNPTINKFVDIETRPKNKEEHSGECSKEYSDDIVSDELCGSDIVFAVINRPAKNSKQYFQVCSKILKRLPKSKILIKVNSVCDQSYIINDMLKQLEITQDRLIIVEYVGENHGYYDLFNKVDILLDTFPYSGTTTTCDALYMSTPVITLYNKNIHAHSVSSSIIKNIDETGDIVSNYLVATDIDDYVNKSVHLATNKELLSLFKQELRPKFLKSMDIVPFIKEYESLLESTLVSEKK